MLSYVYTHLIQKDYKDIDVEVFDNIGDILAVILFKIISIDWENKYREIYKVKGKQ